MDITSIISTSLDSEHVERLKFRLKLYKKYYKDDVHYLFVLSGKQDSQIEALISSYGCDFIYSKGHSFNLSQTRNTGLKLVTTKYVMFEDIDLFHDRNFYKQLLDLTLELEESPFNFICVPVAYLSSKTSQEITENKLDIALIKGIVLKEINYKSCINTEILQHFTPTSSLMLLKTSTALFVGGFDEEIGKVWGGEDRDFIFRLLAINTKIHLPKDFSYTSTETTYSLHKYVGWRALLTMIGDLAYERGIISYHLWHPQKEWRSNNNIAMATQKAKVLGKDYFKYITPLQSNIPSKNQNFIVGRNPYLLNEEIFNYLNGFIILEQSYSNATIFEKLQEYDNIGKIIFWNPYGSDKTLSLFKSCKEKGYKVVVAERGALPDSIIFDPSDLCVFSSHYKREFWNKMLQRNLLKNTKKYIEYLVNDNKTLEKNSQRMNLEIMKKTLNLYAYEHILLVCFQLDDDTVTNTNYEISYPYFIEQIHALAKNLPNNYRLLYKNHPLSNYKHQINNAVCVDEYHLHDLLSICSNLIVYNSGTGVLAQAFGVFTFTFGPCFYSDEYFNLPCQTWQDILNKSAQKHVVNMDKVLLFYHYLLEECYSFCNLSDPVTKIREKSTPTYYQRISYYSIKFPEMQRKEIGFKEIFEPQKSNLFKRFFHELDKKSQNKSKTNTLDTPSVAKNSVSKKWNKLKNDPYSFFNDSKKWWRVFSVFFKK